MVLSVGATQSAEGGRRRRALAAVAEASSGLSFKHLKWSPGVSMWPLRAFWQFISWLRRARDPRSELRSCRCVCSRSKSVSPTSLFLCWCVSVQLSMPSFAPALYTFTPAWTQYPTLACMMNAKWCYSLIWSESIVGTCPEPEVSN